MDKNRRKLALYIFREMSQDIFIVSEYIGEDLGDIFSIRDKLSRLEWYRFLRDWAKEIAANIPDLSLQVVLRLYSVCDHPASAKTVHKNYN